MTTPAARMTVARTLGSDIGLREVLIYLDGEMIATLRNGQSVTREVAPGHHALRAHNTLFGKTIEFEARAGEEVRFTTANRAGCATSLIFFLGAGPIYLSLQREGPDLAAGGEARPAR